MNKIIKILVIIYLIVGLSTNVFASLDEDETRTLKKEEISTNGDVIDNELIERHREVDKYIFETHIKDFEERGITVVTTGINPITQYIDIGIIPYNEENASYVYDALGKDKIKVIEGQKVRTLEMTTTSNKDSEISKAETSNEEPIKHNSGISVFFKKIWKWIKEIF
ncbi:hypothetical protein GOQ27_04440 [Clostridium sp. D2Q-11]|uniref:Uncharacterized protein n=1 Tax=Anaeromonas frigoriresistens TaxID=2683708 RepID=A0A942Z6L1_9FIRM|nr:hypothetical protein [Anaeromonas frigoriresistens]MBS4537697.1 hypothetical protein [Anaeromonas frigoriresistens]